MAPSYSIDELERNKCCDVARSNSNGIHFNLYDFGINIEIIFSYYLTRLNLSGSKLFKIPKCFSNLMNLKECRLSQNNIREISLYISNLQFLHTLHLDSNKIAYLPAFLNDMSSLIQLDIYDNQIETAYCNFESMNCLDIAMNFIDEPDTEMYQFQKKSLREKLGYTRADGQKDWADYIYEGDEYEDNEFKDNDYEVNEFEDNEFEDNDYEDDENHTSSTHADNTIVTENFEEECWDSDSSDENWTPDRVVVPRPNHYSFFHNFETRLMREGHFCPMDAHVEPVPKFEQNDHYEFGQFDDA